ALRPRMLILMESKLWPRMLAQVRWAGIPVVVANARVSGRSFARGMRVRPVWSRLLRQVTLFLAQSEEDARRLIAMGAAAEAVRAVGNLKYAEAERNCAVARRDAQSDYCRGQHAGGRGRDGADRLGGRSVEQARSIAGAGPEASGEVQGGRSTARRREMGQIFGLFKSERLWSGTKGQRPLRFCVAGHDRRSCCGVRRRRCCFCGREPGPARRS